MFWVQFLLEFSLYANNILPEGSPEEEYIKPSKITIKAVVGYERKELKQLLNKETLLSTKKNR